MKSFVRLDFPASAGEVTTLCFSDPAEVIVAREVSQVRAALRAAERAAEKGYHVAGYISYEAAPAFDPAYPVRTDTRLPLVWFGVFRGAEGGEGGTGGSAGIEPVAGTRANRVVAASSEATAAGTSSSYRIGGWEADITRAEYDAAIEELQGAMARGELEQANHTLRLRAPFEGDPLAFYHALLAAQGRAYGAYLDLGFAHIISASPELYFRREGDRIELRPMKGTARRGRWVEEDDEMAARLASSEKDRVENLMTAEWMRRELERLAGAGEVEVTRVCEVERYRTVFQLTTTLAARLPQGTMLEEILAGLFPSASVTGVPRVAAMRRIAELEPAPREVYCGAIGVIRPGGDCTFNVPIRTVWVDTRSGMAEYGVGGGITAASTAAGEYDEVLAKSAVLTRAAPDFELLETLRLADGRYIRLEGHLARLRGSARYFGWTDPVAAARTKLAAHMARWPQGVRRVRVLADARGAVQVESEPFTMDHGVNAVAPASGNGLAARPVGVARNPLAADDPFIYHKTTNRAAYEALLRESPEYFDLLLYNAAGELTEFTRGNLVVELAGVRWTPPQRSGLLAGVFRGELLERGEIRERVLRVPDLQGATGIWLINSLREWVPVDVVTQI